ncbi:hypothetical protein HPP92_017424 [Vanilla planifolia]|uniref:Uncharacterized protein n=1 Tax=Vanilla planifolia TaxID=51239 RepID=A0A835Q7Z4_VANPL|nr:hypothetical protein HPP92_017424 [Vanilla planifolia]
MAVRDVGKIMKAPTSFEGKQKKEMVVFVGSRNRGANGYEEERADDEEGYRTPTSPSHRIPPMARCPPPPKKLASVSRCRKRSKGSRLFLTRNMVDKMTWKDIFEK